MKKSLLALAVLGAFAGVASAQSSVTLYGIVDVGYQYNEVGDDDTNAINGGHQSGNRWGIRGSEDLGGGLKAIFTLENGFSIDTGTQGQGALFGRQAWAGLSGGWGSVVAGRLALMSSGTGSFDFFGRTDPFATGFGLSGMGSTFLSAAAVRVDNTVAYVSPTFGGFKAAAAYSFNIAGQEVAEVGGAENQEAIALAANWTSGPFFAVATYDQVDVAGSGSDQKHLQLGGTFDIGMFRLHAGYGKFDNVQILPSGIMTAPGVSFPTTGLKTIGGFDMDSYMLGVTVKLGAFAILGSYQNADADRVTFRSGSTNVNYEPDYDIWSLGGTYAMSKRTNLYASYGSANADGTLTGANDRTQIALGMRHLF